jgi:aspartyl-tRNA(Asn)/glutamyl-tRNA(Gln) amidotransferase subunit A
MTTDLTIVDFHEGLLAKRFSAREVTQQFLDAIDARDGELGAYLAVRRDAALAEAGRVDELVARGEELPELAGVPLAVKDNILIKGERATAASKILETYVASYDAGVITRLRERHAVFLGKTNLDEFAMGSSTENSAFKLTRNPHDPTRVPGGSSGGSAAAVAAGLALGALGSETGGSIRLPASFCGVVGLKTTYGSVSRSGLIAMASSLDQIGPITKTVRDAAILFRAIAGRDPRDATSADVDFDRSFSPNALEGTMRFTIGLPDEYFIGGLDPQVESAVQSAIRTLEQAGLRFKKISLPHTRYALATYYIIVPAEVSANLARFDGMRYARTPQTDADDTQTNADNVSRRSAPIPRQSALAELYLRQRGHGFGPEAKRRIILGTFVLSAGYYDAYYQKAQQVRTLIARDFEEAFKSVDVILTPVAPTPAFKIGERTSDPLSMYLSDVFMVPANLAGLPALALPVRARNDADNNPSARLRAGAEQRGSKNIRVNRRSNPRESALPVGFQLIGRHFREADILGVGYRYEQAA